MPDVLHARLTAAAKRHRRSLNKEAIVCLEAGLGSANPSADEERERITVIRNSLGPHCFDPEAIFATHEPCVSSELGLDLVGTSPCIRPSPQTRPDEHQPPANAC
jgi:hypothetical protein